MFAVLITVPVFAAVAMLLLYRQTGKKEILKFDTVQLVYAFVIAPLMFVWLKSLLYYVLRVESTPPVSMGDVILVDTIFSVVFLYIYAFIVAHWLTKNFEVKRLKDPLYDILQDSEKIHLWISHTFIYIGILVIATMLSIANVVFPMDLDINRFGFFGVLLIGYIAGWLACIGVWLFNVQRYNFFLLMKLCFAGMFLVHLCLSVLIRIPFSQTYTLYWTTFFSSVGLVTASFLLEKSSTLSKWVNKLHHPNPSKYTLKKQV